jgi:hypothetical protein
VSYAAVPAWPFPWLRRDGRDRKGPVPLAPASVP